MEPLGYLENRQRTLASPIATVHVWKRQLDPKVFTHSSFSHAPYILKSVDLNLAAVIKLKVEIHELNACHYQALQDLLLFCCNCSSQVRKLLVSAHELSAIFWNELRGIAWPHAPDKEPLWKLLTLLLAWPRTSKLVLQNILFYRQHPHSNRYFFPHMTAHSIFNNAEISLPFRFHRVLNKSSLIS